MEVIEFERGMELFWFNSNDKELVQVRLLGFGIEDRPYVLAKCKNGLVRLYWTCTFAKTPTDYLFGNYCEIDVLRAYRQRLDDTLREALDLTIDENSRFSMYYYNEEKAKVVSDTFFTNKVFAINCDTNGNQKLKFILKSEIPYRLHEGEAVDDGLSRIKISKLDDDFNDSGNPNTIEEKLKKFNSL